MLSRQFTRFENAVTNLPSFPKSIALLRDERGIFAHWLADVTDLAISGKRAHDARLVAAMQRHGLQQIVTFNKSDFNGFPNLSVFLPHEVA
jgi:predicted nucleic acid-binding protein